MILKSSSQLIPQHYKVLLHGNPGTGKTMSIATAVAPLLILTERGGSDSLTPTNIARVFGAGRPDINYDVPVAEAYDYTSFVDVMRFLTGSSEAKNFRTIFLDSASQMSTAFLKHFQAASAHGAAAYGDMGKQVVMVFESLMTLPYDVVMIAHTDTMEEGTPDNKIIRKVPAFEGRMLMREIPHLVSEWYYSDTDFADDGSTKYVIRTTRSAKGEAKSRFGLLDPVEPPNWERIFAKLREGNNAPVPEPKPISPIPAKTQQQ